MGTIVEPLQMETINPAISGLAVFIAGIAYCRIKSLNFSLDRFGMTWYDLGGGIMENETAVNDILAFVSVIISFVIFFGAIAMV